MKMTLTFLAVVMLATFTICAQDVSAKSLRYRNGSTLSFDSTTSILDEAGAWTLTPGQLGKLALLQSGKITMGTNTLSTNAFTLKFSLPPVVVTSSGSVSNRADYVSSVTTSNVIIGASATNATIYWIAFGSP